ncbi:hypothetical protein JXA88_00610 [Candidatus Fermentibacteria bacterium]|nr:hypothetical protein [Candidatus Fermentibacteria bacterium]
MRTPNASTIVRRSVALPRSLVEEVTQWVPEHLRGNFNRLVAVALSEYATNRRQQLFEQAMADMARDPQIRAACAGIEEEFLTTEWDGLGELS